MRDWLRALPEGSRIWIHGRTWRVRVPTVQAAQQACILAIGAEPADRIRLRVRQGRGPSGWIGTPGIRGLSRLQVQPTRRGGSRVDLQVAQPTDPALLLAAAIRTILPAAAQGLPDQCTVLPGLPADASWWSLGLRDVLLGTDRPSPHLRRSDLVVSPVDSDPAAYPDRADTIVVRAHGHWTVQGAPREVHVDPSVHHPIGRRSPVAGTLATATRQSQGWLIQAPGLRLEIGDDLSAPAVAGLREVDGLIVPAGLPPRLAAQLRASGLVLAEGVDELPGDLLGWLHAGVVGRREALRDHSPRAALDRWPSVSAVLLTHRADFIDHAVAQLARLAYPRLEVVIGLHGITVPGERFAPLAERHGLQVVEVPADLPFGAAMQVACQRAAGELITKVDDDDLYHPEHLWDLVLAREYSGAQLVGKALDWVVVESAGCTVFRPEYPAEQYARFVAGATMLISQEDFRAVGGFRPVPRSIDRSLIKRVLAHGGLIYRTHGLGYLYLRRGSRHTATVSDEHFLADASARWDGILRHDAFGTASIDAVQVAGAAEPMHQAGAG